MRNLSVNKGFTLLEVLIALVIFAILGGLTSSIMFYVFSTRTRLTEQSDRLVNLQLALTLVSRDITQATNRPVRGNERTLIAAFIGKSNYTEFTRGGMINPNSEFKQSTLKRIAFLCEKNQLIRRSWGVIDVTNRQNYTDRVLLDNINRCSFAYLDQNLQVLDEWHENAVQQDQKPKPLPKAIRLSFTVDAWGDFNQLFIIPEALYVDLH